MHTGQVRERERIIWTRNRQARGHELPGVHLARTENGPRKRIGERVCEPDGIAPRLTHAQVKRYSQPRVFRVGLKLRLRQTSGELSKNKKSEAMCEGSVSPRSITQMMRLGKFQFGS